jgi:signal peptidase II
MPGIRLREPPREEDVVIRALRFSFLLSVLVSCVGCDQATKSAARRLLASSGPVSILNGLVRFEYAENPGAFLGLGADLPGSLRFLIFVVFTGTVLALTPLLALKGWDKTPTRLTGVALVVGGGLGNLIDRVVNDGRVVDFVSVGVGSLRTGIMNVADVAVFAGAALLLCGLLREQEKPTGAA